MSTVQAFCSISTGTYEYPIYDATHIALDTVRTFLETEAAVKVQCCRQMRFRRLTVCF
jgi:O-acetyl-ADP-ribose deacetylase (regulator of RNase III)